jgi:two-component system sensor histidine kinase and response regulator WspE
MSNAENIDPSLLELFRVEVENQAEVLVAGMLEIEKGAANADTWDAMMRAAHSIKGAARMVELDPVAALAHELEDVFQHAQQRQAAPHEDLVAALFSASDLLAQLARQDADRITGWLQERGPEPLELANRVKQLREGGRADPPAAAQRKAAPAASARPVPDEAMYELFQIETEAQTATLNEALLAIERGRPTPDVYEAAMRAAHSLKGAARLIDLPEAVQLAHVMEDVFTAAQRGEAVVSADAMDLMLAATDLLGRLGQLRAPQVPGWLDQNASALTELAAQISGAEAPPVALDLEPAAPETEAMPLELEQSAPLEVPEALRDTAMLELVLTDIRSNVPVMEEFLQAGETATPDQLEGAIRAVHSLRGTARIVELPPLVTLGAAMEERLLLARDGGAALDADALRALEDANAIFRELPGLNPEEIGDWLQQCARRVATLVPAVSAGPGEVPPPFAAQAEAAPAQPVRAPAPAPAGPRPAAPVSERRETSSVGRRDSDADRERWLRVTAAHLDRLMGLSGETLVGARRLAALSGSMQRLKSRQSQLFTQLSELFSGMGSARLSQTQEDLLKSSRQLVNECRQLLAERMDSLDTLSQRETGLSDRFHHEVMESRMRPFSDGTRGFPRMARDVAKQLGKRVQLVIEGDNTLVDREILEHIEAPLNHMIRNAIDHGLEDPQQRKRLGKPETGTIRVSARHASGLLQVTVADDGRGVDLGWLRGVIVERNLATREMAEEMSEQELLEFLFLPNFSTAAAVTDISGRGMGMNIVQETVRELGGSLRTETEVGKGLTIEMNLPISASVLHALLVQISDESYAFPLSRIRQAREVLQTDLRELEGRQYVEVDGRNVGLVPAYQVLELARTPQTGARLSVVVIADHNREFGLIVDRFRGQHDLVVQKLDPRLGTVRDVSAAAVLDDGSPTLVLDVEDLLRSVELLVTETRLEHVSRDQAGHERQARKRVLVVDDSITVREVQRKLLTAAGYDVDIAVDGLDGWNAVRTHDYDMVISDIDMPRMNGIKFVQAIKGHPVLKALPVMIVSYKDREEDRRAGLEAGADYYLTKGSFQDETLIEAVMEMIGAPEE